MDNNLCLQLNETATWNKRSKTRHLAAKQARISGASSDASCHLLSSNWTSAMTLQTRTCFIIVNAQCFCSCVGLKPRTKWWVEPFHWCLSRTSCRQRLVSNPLQIVKRTQLGLVTCSHSSTIVDYFRQNSWGAISSLAEEFSECAKMDKITPAWWLHRHSFKRWCDAGAVEALLTIIIQILISQYLLVDT